MKVDRLVSIILLLLEKERIGAQELAQRFEVSLRTIYRDIEAISMAGIPVRGASGVGGGFEIMREYKLDKSVFSAAELSALLTGLSSLSNLIQGDELANTLAKLKSLIPVDRTRDVERKANQIVIDSNPWMGGRNIQPCLDMIQTALRECKLLSFAYSDRYGNKSTRTAEPYQLVMKGSQWYLQGYCRIRQDYRLFKLSRMSGLQLQAECFVPREYERPQLEFSGLLQALQTKIRLRIHQSIMDRVLDFCPGGHVAPDGGEYYMVDFPFIENDYYYSILFSFGNKCECLEPPHVRAEMLRRIRDLAAVYEDGM